MYLLISGASGHIGSCLSKICNEKNIKTILLTRSKEKKKFLKSKFKKCIVITNNQLKKYKYNISIVIHTASLNDKDSNKSKNSLKKNLDITIKLFKDLNTKNLKKIIYLSSAQVYGSSLIGKVKEEKNLFPKNNYGKSRYLNEIFLKRYSELFKKNLIILRISNVVGVPAIYNRSCLRLLPNDIKNQSELNGELNLRSSGLQYRNFISMKFLTQTILKLKKKRTEGILIFNLGSINTKIINFVKEFAKNYKIKKNKILKINILSNLPKTTKKLSYDDSKIRKFLGLKRKENLTDILKSF